MNGIAKHNSSMMPLDIQEVESKIIEVRGSQVLLDKDVASLYDVQTREINQAVRNNPEKFPEGYVFELNEEESALLRSKILTLEHNTGKGRHTKYNYKAFSEKGLYMLATILKGKKAAAATIAIIETFAKVRSLKRELVELHKEQDQE